SCYLRVFRFAKFPQTQQPVVEAGRYHYQLPFPRRHGLKITSIVHAFVFFKAAQYCKAPISTHLPAQLNNPGTSVHTAGEYPNSPSLWLRDDVDQLQPPNAASEVQLPQDGSFPAQISQIRVVDCIQPYGIIITACDQQSLTSREKEVKR